MAINIKTYLENYNNDLYDSPDFESQCAAGWYDWFCKTESLAAKTKKLTAKLKTIVSSSKINQETHYVWFKNNCPMVGRLYDDFRIADVETGETIYTIIPKSGFERDFGTAYVYGRENDFVEPLAKGTWKDIKEFFNK